MEAARTVKDVSPHDFVKAYSAHLKRSGKVCSLPSSLSPSLFFGLFKQRFDVASFKFFI